MSILDDGCFLSCYLWTCNFVTVPDGWLHEYLQMIAKADHVRKFVEENPFGMRPITDGTVFWPFYAKFVKEPNWPVM